MRVIPQHDVSPSGPAPVACDVSVLTPSYEYGRFIRDAVLSVLEQHDLALEHIVQDGGSRDQTTAVLREFQGFVRWQSEPDRGQSDALNKAFATATGRWIGWLNADEFYMPGALRQLVEHGDETGADVVYGDTLHCDEHGRLLRLVPQHRPNRFVLKAYGAFIDSGSAIFRRNVLGQDPWDVAQMPWGLMDWDLLLRLLSEGVSFAYLPRPIGVFRVHPARQTAKPENFAYADSILADRYGLSLTWLARQMGRHLHGIYKLAHGSYKRQLTARHLHGIDLRWFRPEIGPAGCEAICRRCYGAAA